MLAPSQVYSFGNVPLFVKAVLLKVKGVFLVVTAVVTSSFLQDRNTKSKAMKKSFFIIFFAKFSQFIN